MERFAPTIEINGETITPAGWMWVLAFALRGVPWALIEVRKPGFDKIITDWRNKQRVLVLEAEYDDLLATKTDLEEKLVTIGCLVAEAKSIAEARP